MFRYKKISAFLLLAIYGVVFGHSIVPHHHHIDTVVCANEWKNHMDSCNDCHSEFSCGHDHRHDVSFSHDHSHQTHDVCDFEVNPLIQNGLILALLYLPSVIAEIRVPETDSPVLYQQYTPQKILAGYSFAVPLRAPPVFFNV